MTTKPEYARQLSPWEIKQINGKSAPSSPSVDSKTPITKVDTVFNPEINEDERKVINNSEIKRVDIPVEVLKELNAPISVNDLKAADEALRFELENRVDLDKFQHEENQEYIAELLEEIADKAEKIEEERENARGWEEKYKKEYECSAMWRDRFLDMERQKNKLEQTVGVEVSYRKYAEKLMDEALIAAHRDDELLALLAEKFVTNRKKNLEGN